MRRFPAAYDGDCKHCYFDISQGDSIGYIDDEIACESCCDAEEEFVNSCND